MGYTHYASRPKTLPIRKFKLAAEDCRKVVEALCLEKGFKVQFSLDDPKPPHFGADSIRFNGEGENGHETFVIDRVYEPYSEQPKPSRGEGWIEFTKTARKPYDAAVCACLIVFQHYLGKAYSVRSDGNDDDEGWVAARAGCQRVLGYGADFTLKVPPKMTVHGLVLTGGWFQTADGCWGQYLSNGWELRRPRRAAFKYTIHTGQSGENDGFIAGGDFIVDARWKATVAYFQVEFKDAPFLDEFRNAMQEMPGEWSTFRAWSDKLQDHGHEDIAKKVRERIPR
jgi:hypothetical protein